MHDIRAIRENPAAFDAALSRRGMEPQSPSILKIDEERRAAIHAAETAQDEGIRIYSILVGREGTAMVPTGRRLADGSSRYRQENYPVDPDLLTDIAELTGGRFYRAAAPDELERDLNEILDELERTQM